MISSEPVTDRRLLVLSSVLFVLIVLLGAAQISWVRTAAVTEADHMRDAMWLRGARAAETATGEVWYLFDLVREGVRQNPEEPIEEVYRRIVEEWIANTEYPEILVAMYEGVQRADGEWAMYRFDTQSATMEELSDAEGDRLSSWLDPAVQANSGAGFVVRMGGGIGGGDGTARLALVETDDAFLLQEVLPDLLQEEGERFGILIRSPDGTVLFDRDVAAGLNPDVSVPIALFKPPPDRFPGRPFDGNDSFFATERYLRTGVPRSAPEGPVLELYRTGRSIPAYARVRRITNTLFATSVLVLVATALVAVFLMYRRSRLLLVQHQEFVSLTGHELRTPVTIIRSAAENLRSGIIADGDRVRSYGEVIVQNADRLGRGIDNVMTFSGMQKRKPDPESAPETDVGETLRECVRQLEPVAATSGGEVFLEVAGETGIRRVDPDSLSLIVGNLVQNALLHAVPLCLPEERRVEVLVGPAPYGRIRIQVTDHGPGIPRRERRTLFEPFTRGSASRERQVPGHGLGLHIVSRIVRSTGGRISVESPIRSASGDGAGTGSRFTVLLPAPVAAEAFQ